MCRKVWGFESLRGHHLVENKVRFSGLFFHLYTAHKQSTALREGLESCDMQSHSGVAIRDRAPSVGTIY